MHATANAWGHLTLSAMPHLILRPAVALSGNAERPGFALRQPFIAPSTAWGPPSTPVRRAEIHREAARVVSSP
eukprot:6888767-Pyramimonas_sp.AAC.1